jgi:hypothetical protein
VAVAAAVAAAAAAAADDDDDNYNCSNLTFKIAPTLTFKFTILLT